MNEPARDVSLVNQLERSADELLRGLRTTERLLQVRDYDRGFDSHVWSALAGAGWFGTALAERFGGLGLGISEVGALLRSVGNHLCSGPLYEHLVVLPQLLDEASSSTQAALVAAVAGEKLLAWVPVPEPDTQRPRYGMSFDGRVLNGFVPATPFAQDTEVLAVGVQSRARPVVAVVDLANVGRTPCSTGDPTIQYANLEIRNLELEESDVVVEGQAAAQLMRTIEGLLRLAAAAELAGLCSHLTDMTLDYARSRHQFGRPIAGFQVIRHELADMATHAYAARNLVEACLNDADLDADRIPELGRIARVYTGRLARRLAETSLQLHGGIGFTAEFRLHLYYRRALTLQGYMGEASDLLVELAENTLAQASWE